MVESDRWDREKSEGWMGARSFAAREREKGSRGDGDTPRGKDGAGDGKTVIVSESEDNYSDRGLHKRERSSRVSVGAGIRG